MNRDILEGGMDVERIGFKQRRFSLSYSLLFLLSFNSSPSSLPSPHHLLSPLLLSLRLSSTYKRREIQIQSLRDVEHLHLLCDLGTINHNLEIEVRKKGKKGKERERAEEREKEMRKRGKEEGVP